MTFAHSAFSEILPLGFVVSVSFILRRYSMQKFCGLSKQNCQKF
jgi:hypothetical protein